MPRQELSENINKLATLASYAAGFTELNKDIHVKLVLTPTGVKIEGFRVMPGNDHLDIDYLIPYETVFLGDITTLTGDLDRVFRRLNV